MATIVWSSELISSAIPMTTKMATGRVDRVGRAWSAGASMAASSAEASPCPCSGELLGVASLKAVADRHLFGTYSAPALPLRMRPDAPERHGWLTAGDLLRR